MSSTTGSAYNVINRFFMVRDSATGTSASAIAANTPSLPITLAKLDDATSAAYSSDQLDAGYYLTFSTGEKAVSAPVTVSGKTYVGTNQPKAIAANSCASNLGTARGYAVSPFSASFTSSAYDGGGMPPTATTGYVTIKLPGNKTITKQFCIGCGGGVSAGSGGTGNTGNGSDGSSSAPPCKSSLENCANPGAVPRNPRRTYWYKN